MIKLKYLFGIIFSLLVIGNISAQKADISPCGLNLNQGLKVDMTLSNCDVHFAPVG